MPVLTTYIPGTTANIKPTSNVRAAPDIQSKLLRTTTTKEPVTLTGTVVGDVDPANNSNVWYTWWKNNRWEYTAKDNIVDLKAPAEDGFTAATQAAAVKAATDPLNARITNMKAKTAAYAADIAND